MENTQTSGTLFDLTSYVAKWPRAYEDFGSEAKVRIRDAVCERLANIGECDAEDVIDVAEEIILWHRHDDGYELAKFLENHHSWGIEVSDVEDLDMVPYDISDAIRAEIARWVQANGIQPTFKVGDKVTWHDRWDNKDFEGEITKVDAEHGEVHVFCEALGHIRSGQGQGRSITTARILTVEQVKPTGEEKKDE